MNKLLYHPVFIICSISLSHTSACKLFRALYSHAILHSFISGLHSTICSSVITDPRYLAFENQNLLIAR